MTNDNNKCLNNKGMTLVELIVSFVLVMLIIVGIYNLILQLKFDLDDKKIEKDIEEYSSTISNDIHYGLIDKKPYVIAYNYVINNVIKWNYICRGKDNNSFHDDENTCNDGDGSPVTLSEVSDATTEASGKCLSDSKCVIYFYGSNLQNHGIISIGQSDGEKGIKYTDYRGGNSQDVFEPLPDNDYVNIPGTVISSDPTIDPKDPNNIRFLVIKFPIIFKEKDYGFKIVYPFPK